MARDILVITAGSVTEENRSAADGVFDRSACFTNQDLSPRVRWQRNVYRFVI
ncbi:hypothetical protein J3A64_001345 [Pseudarthrobacter sp. PvP004]|uniref:Uncharacterized protein n=1 Tax=Paenarthrobacter aurescens (strain TC1) TaxID=290340 RepID=A1R692_PAEAT|nr:hypothetical protein [Pseudarthrobacter sp. PvP004]ABM06568.1 hypothetical protein AAur_2009 [Paenarthrobacter aurescens TC1]MBP2265881.1 hypothetical protein [Pseudarthrobacter sp. PvP004]